MTPAPEAPQPFKQGKSSSPISATWYKREFLMGNQRDDVQWETTVAFY